MFECNPYKETMKSIFLSVALALAVPLAICNIGTNRGAVAETQLPTAQSSRVSATTIAAVTTNWYSYTAKDNSYSVKFPNQPQEENESVNTSLGTLNYLQVMYEDTVNNRAYLTTSQKFPVGANQINAEEFLDEVRDGQAEGGKATIISEKKISLNGFPGREITFKEQQGMAMKSRIFIDPKGPTLYQIILVAEDGNLAFPEAQAFLESFAIPK